MTEDATNTSDPGDVSTNSSQGPTQKDLDSARDKANTAVAEAEHYKRQLADYQKLGTPDEIKGRQEDYFNMRKDNTGSADEVEALVAERVGQFKTEFENKISELTSTNSTQAEKIKDLTVYREAMGIAANLFNSDSLELIERVVKERCDLVDGKVVIYKEGETNGERVVALSPTNPSQNMSVEEFMNELAGKYKSAAKPKQKSGTMTGKEQVNGTVDETGLTVQDWRAMSAEERKKLPTKTIKRLANASINAPL